MTEKMITLKSIKIKSKIQKITRIGNYRPYFALEKPVLPIQGNVAGHS